MTFHHEASEIGLFYIFSISPKVLTVVHVDKADISDLLSHYLVVLETILLRIL